MTEWRDASGRLTVHLGDDENRFTEMVSRLKTRCCAHLIQKLDGLDQHYWDFDVKGVVIVLHWDGMMGVSIHVQEGTNEDILRSVARKCLEE